MGFFVVYLATQPGHISDSAMDSAGVIRAHNVLKYLSDYLSCVHVDTLYLLDVIQTSSRRQVHDPF